MCGAVAFQVTRMTFTCACGKSFYARKHLEEHKRTHTGERLTCSDCGSSQSNEANLVRHRNNCVGHRKRSANMEKWDIERAQLQRKFTDEREELRVNFERERERMRERMDNERRELRARWRQEEREKEVMAPAAVKPPSVPKYNICVECFQLIEPHKVSEHIASCGHGNDSF